MWVATHALVNEKSCTRPLVRPTVRKFYFVRTITRHRFELESPNLHQTCIMGYSRLVLKLGSLTLTFMVILVILTSILENMSSTRGNSEWVSTRITKVASNLHFGILSVGIENRGHWPCPSRSFGHFDSEFQEMALNVALVYWYRLVKGVLHTPACSCCSNDLHTKIHIKWNLRYIYFHN